MRNVIQVNPRNLLPLICPKQLPNTPQDTHQRDLPRKPLILLRRNRRIQELLPPLNRRILLHNRRPSIERRKMLVADVEYIPQPRAVGRLLTLFLDGLVVAVV